MVAFAWLVFLGAPLWAFLHVLGRRATSASIAAGVIFAWLAMPLMRVNVPLLPDLEKETLVVGAVLAGMLAAGRRLPRGVGLGLADVAVAVLCVAPFCASVANGLGVFDGISSALRHVFVFAVPYAIGRIAFADARSLRDLARFTALGALCYLPPILLESRMAPQLHQWVFGMPGRVGWETADFYGPLRWKPSVFLQSPLELTLLMGMGAMAAWWLWRLGERRIGPVPIRLAVPAAAFATLMGKSLGGVTLTFAGVASMWLVARRGGRVLLLALLCAVPLYIGLRASGAWDGMSFIRFLETNVSERRAESFLTRIVNENILVEKALEQPLFGWGGWGRNRVYDEEGNDISITDGFWVITLGTYGWVGLGGWLALFFFAIVPLLARWRSRGFQRLRAGPALWGVLAVLLHSIDCIANAMLNPLYYILLGALASAGQTGAVVENSDAAPAGAAAMAARGGRGRAPLQPRRPAAVP
jgi:hypothetical protein